MIMNLSIETISYDDIFKIWRTKLWPNRISAIEPTSAMNYLGGYDLKNMQFTPTYFGCFINNLLIGVNSGHLCFDKTYRSRGLFVDSEYRKLGIGKKLLLATIERGQQENASLVWSYPKQSSWKCYASAGFNLTTDWQISENDINAYCTKFLK